MLQWKSIFSTLDTYAQAVDTRLTDVLNKAAFDFQSADYRVKRLEKMLAQINAQLNHLTNAPSNHYIGSPNSGFEDIQTRHFPPESNQARAQVQRQPPGIDQQVRFANHDQDQYDRRYDPVKKELLKGLRKTLDDGHKKMSRICAKSC